MVARLFRSRKPKSSPLWKCFDGHFERFIAAYPHDYQSRYGVLRGVIPEVVDKFMGCGDFAKGFARVRCDECSHEYLLAFSCKGRWFCPSCHQKKVQMFGAMLAESILAVVPHRHFTFTIPKMLRPYFRFHRGLLKQLCRIAHQCVSDFLRDAFGDAGGVGNAAHDGVPAIVMAIHTFGEYLDFHPHLHALVADGLFDREGRFHVMRTGELTGELTQEQRGTTDAFVAGNHAALEQLFRARVIAFLVEAGLLPLDRARMLRGWVHSGFQVHQSRRIAANECQDMERLAQYIVRNPFSVAKMQVNRSSDSILYRSGMNAKIKRNFQVFSACDFIAAITQHIPDKRFQMVRYYGWYSNKMRGQRRKRAEEAACECAATAEQGCGAGASSTVEIIQHLAPKPRRMPSRSWRELIKKVWEVDPLLCPQCHHEMRIVSRRTCRAPARNAGKANSYQLEQGMASAALTMSKPRVHLTIDRAFMELGSPAEAVTAFEAACALAPGWAEAQSSL